MAVKDETVVDKDKTVVERDETVVEKQHAWDSPPVVRAVATLFGVAAAGFLIWLETGFDLGTTGEYWAVPGAPAWLCRHIAGTLAASNPDP